MTVKDISEEIIEKSEYLKYMCNFGVNKNIPLTHDCHFLNKLGTPLSVAGIETELKNILELAGITTPVFYPIQTLERISTVGLPVYVFVNEDDEYFLEVVVQDLSDHEN